MAEAATKTLRADPAKPAGPLDGSEAGAFRATLAANLDAFRAHHPAVFARLVESAAQPSLLKFARGADGAWTLARLNSLGKPTLLALGGAPKQAAEACLAQFTDRLGDAPAVALCGLGDGHLLDLFHAQRPRTLLSMSSAIYVIESDPAVLLHVLMLHDWSGPDGPIRSSRVRWFIGRDWARTLWQQFEDEPCLAEPDLTLTQGQGGVEVQQPLTELLQALDRRTRATLETLAADYAARPASMWVSLLGETPPRPPRILLLTTRFSTVLQHSTRDTAAALERLGWQPRVLIEPADHLRITRRWVARTLEEFRPDVVFQIDHLRHEHPGLIPLALPFVCWVQDDLGNLTNPAAGASITPRDFVLTATEAMYAARFGYPRRQCVYLSKLTRVPERPVSWTSDGDDLTFVSNASGLPEAIAERLVREVGLNDAAKVLVRRSCDLLIQEYRRGASVALLSRMRAMVRQAARELNITGIEGPAVERVTHTLFNQLNNALYRQQALDWIASAAESRGLSLSLYGEGWDRHPRFSRYARGTVAYGPDLEELTRRSKINLQIVPFVCTHQRLLDGLVAGGFFLVRRHPLDDLTPAVGEFLRRHLTDDIADVPAARRTWPTELVRELDVLSARFDQEVEHGGLDLIQGYRLQLAHDAGYLFEPIPHFNDVCFDDAATLQARIAAFIDNPEARRGVCQDQRNFVERSYTYEAGLARAMRQIGRRLAAEEGPAMRAAS